MADQLRIGILCDGLTFQRWQAECIQQVLAVPGVIPVLVVVQDKPAKVSLSFSQRVLRYPWRMAFYLWWRNNRFKPVAYEPIDLSTVLGPVPRLNCRPLKMGIAQGFNAKDLGDIASARPEVLLRFGFNILKGDILQLPRYGVWSYHHGDEEEYRGQPPGLWEIMDQRAVTGAILQRLTEKLDAGLILRKGWFRTAQHSLATTVDNVLMGSAGWAAHVCRELLNGNEAAANGTLSKTTAPIRKYPGNLDFLELLMKSNSSQARLRKQQKQEREEWNVGLLYQPISALLEPKPNVNVRWLPAPGEGQSRSAPFGYMAEDQLNVLYGKFDVASGKADISRLRPKRDNVLKRSRTMLMNDGSPSYPYVIEHNGIAHVVPENSSNGRVDLYRVNATNDGLERIGTLLEEPLLSPTLFQHEGRWWLMGTKAPLDDVALYIYHAAAMEGPFVPHMLNPVKMDVRSARPGGTPFVHQGQLYRPAQDGSQTHGWRVALMRVNELSPTVFREEQARTIGPFKGSMWSAGLHTLSAVGEFTLVDGKRYVSAEIGSKSKSKRSGSSRSDRTEHLEDEDDD
jgi:hypothetical protein